MDAATFVGCLLTARPIGVIEARQTQERKTFRNDRIIAVSDAAHQYARLKSLRELDPRIVDEIEHFFVSYNEMRDRHFKPIRRAGASSALSLVRRRMRAFAAKEKTE
jgi:inorganic pyrophosphatase